MKNFLITLPILCLFLTITILMSACSIGTSTITFETNGGTCYTTEKTYQAGESVTSLPYATKTDFKHEGWYYDKELTRKVYTPFSAFTTTLYAKYEIDENCYISNDRNIEYSGDTTKKLITFNKTGIHRIMLKQQSQLIKFTSVSIESDLENNSSFDCSDVKLYDINGFIINDGYWETNEWQPESPMESTMGLFLIEFNVTQIGDAYIVINGNYIY